MTQQQVNYGMSGYGEGVTHTASFEDDTVQACLADPPDKQACKNGGWASYGFRNQGLCIRFVNTGKDSRWSPYRRNGSGSTTQKSGCWMVKSRSVLMWPCP